MVLSLALFGWQVRLEMTRVSRWPEPVHDGRRRDFYAESQQQAMYLFYGVPPFQRGR